MGRIDQLDSIELDLEFNQSLKNKLRNCLKFFPDWILVKILPELEAILQLAIYFLSLRGRKSSVGQQFLGLKWEETKWKNIWIFLEVFPNYLKSRFNLDTSLLSFAKFINLLVFFQVSFVLIAEKLVLFVCLHFCCEPC